MPVRISAAHMRLSDTYMNDATSGAMSPRGSCDAAFESGYFALLSALTSDERAASSHPSELLVVLASRRLGLDPSPGVALAAVRYSPEAWTSLEDVVAWAEKVRARARELADS